MKLTIVAAVLCTILLSPLPAGAQFAPPNDAGVTLGHIHLIVTDMEAQKQFWTSVMGGTLVAGGPFTMIAFPEVYVVLEIGKPTGPSEGSVLNHFGFAYKDLAAQVARWQAQHVDVRMNANGNQGYVYGPDGAHVELAADPELAVPFRMDHLHMNVPDIPAAQAWYEKTFGGRTGQRKRNAGPGVVECSYFPGMTISYNPLGRGATAPLLGTKGRGIDHFGFEVKNLNAFVARLQANGVQMDTVPHVLPNTHISSAFLTDPWGNYIEITENFSSAAR
jgi:catechol 2,3-dioxygenase-like lactoylglutathione lyase family enzyme